MAGIVEPERFWAMTPHEIGMVLRGFFRRMLAYQAVARYAAEITLIPWGGSEPRPPFELDGDE